MMATPAAQQLVAEAGSGSSRRVALHILFEGIDTALHDMEREIRDVQAGRATFSVHQPDLEKVRRVAHSSCMRALAMREIRKVRILAADCGFFGNFLSVLDVLLLAPPDLEVEVDWRLNAHGRTYQHFTYKPPNPSDCVWKSLFQPIRARAGSRGAPCTLHLAPLDGGGSGGNARAAAAAAGSDEEMAVDGRFNFLLTSRFRWFFRNSPHNPDQRAAYYAAYHRWVQPSHPQLLDEMRGLGAELREHVSIGVHKRVDTPGTVEYQGAKRVFSSREFIHAVKQLIQRIEAPGGSSSSSRSGPANGGPPKAVTRIFLATDDAKAEEEFRAAFGPLLRMRDGVQRVSGGLNADGTLNEVHIKSPHNPTCSLQDAVDVVADALLLSCCGWVVHMDSNVTSTVTLMNPEATMVHMVDAMGLGN